MFAPCRSCGIVDLDHHGQRRGVAVPGRQGGVWLGVARARTLSLATLVATATALPLASVFNSFAVAHACVRASLSVVSPPWGHRRSRCDDEKRGAAAGRLAGGAGARASSSCSPLVGATLLPVMGRPCRSNRRVRVCVHSALAGATLCSGGVDRAAVWHVAAPGCRGLVVSLDIRVCTRSDGACLPSPVVGRCVGVRVVARACECVSLVGARVFVSFGLVAPRSANE